MIVVYQLIIKCGKSSHYSINKDKCLVQYKPSDHIVQTHLLGKTYASSKMNLKRNGVYDVKICVIYTFKCNVYGIACEVSIP